MREPVSPAQRASASRPGRLSSPGLAAVKADPRGCGGRRDLESLGGAPQRPAIIHDAPGQAQSAGLGQQGITVRYEDLPVVLR